MSGCEQSEQVDHLVGAPEHYRWHSEAKLFRSCQVDYHATMKELVRYTKAADQARLARNAMTRTTIVGGAAR